jgi:hypothetical protein
MDPIANPRRQESVKLDSRLLKITVLYMLAERAGVKPGMTFQVRVDPDDDPKNVLLDLTPAAQPPHAESSD